MRLRAPVQRHLNAPQRFAEKRTGAPKVQADESLTAATKGSPIVQCDARVLQKEFVRLIHPCITAIQPRQVRSFQFRKCDARQFFLHKLIYIIPSAAIQPITLMPDTRPR